VQIDPIGDIGILNPCGELSMSKHGGICQLGHINLSRMVKKGIFDFSLFCEIIERGVLFLDTSLDKCNYPFEYLKKQALKYRRIGLGFAGLQECLVKLGIKYSSKEALDFCAIIGETLRNVSYSTSEKLGKERGLVDSGKLGIPRRNTTINTIAPTGTTARILGTTHGIEPIIARKTVSHIADMKYVETWDNPLYETAEEIEPIQHLKIQATLQKYIDNSISKTIILPKDAKVEDVDFIYRKAYELGCKGVTIYRTGSRNAPIKCSSEDGSCNL